MKHLISVILLLAITLLGACAIRPNSSVPTVDGNVATVSPATPTTIPVTTQTTENNVNEETEVRDVATNFGKRLQDVSLLAPDAAQEIQNQYAEFVSPTLLEMWMTDASKAPGRMVSSPWPDHIDITTVSKEDSDKYEVTGFVIEVTSMEVINGGAAARIPVRIVVQKDQGRWYISEYTEKR